MPANHPVEKTQLDNILLSARLELKEHALNGAIREIYDNIAQALSLVMVNLSALQLQLNIADDLLIADSKSLLGQSVRDLRAMASQFHPEKGLTSAADLVSFVEIETKHWYPGVQWQSHGKTVEDNWDQPDNLIIAFSLILQLLRLASQQRLFVTEAGIKFNDLSVLYIIFFNKTGGCEISEMLTQRLLHINGKIECTTVDAFQQSIVLTIPFNNIV